MLDAAYCGSDITASLRHCEELNAEFYSLMIEYKEACSTSDYSEAHLHNIENQCKKFFRFLQRKGINTVGNITPQVLLDYHNWDIGSTRNIRMMSESPVKGLLHYLSERDLVDDSLWMFIEYLQDDLVFLVALLEDEEEKLKFASEEGSAGVSASVFLQKSKELLEQYFQNGYSATIVSISSRALIGLYAFLNVNKLDYSFLRAQLWLDHVKPAFHKSYPTARRILLQFEDYMNGRFRFDKMYTNLGDTEFQKLPLWCRKEIDAYVELRKKEKMTDSTLSMDICACTKLCRYLADEGVTSFKEVTGEMLKAFNLTDSHKTTGGKNAYNVRIQGFLRYLGRKGLLANPMLHMALIAKASSSEKFIEVLSAEDKAAIEEYCKNAVTPLQLRDKAILRLGVMMGIRGCDIVQMKIDDIDWKARTISFFQDKTDVQVKLAMPVHVGNALYEYLSKGRPKGIQTNLVFVSTRASFGAVSTNVCRQALQRVLDTHGGRFHTSRRTFTTDMFNAGNSRSQIADATGHQSTKSLNPYLSLEVANMQECPLSLENLGLEMPNLTL